MDLSAIVSVPIPAPCSTADNLPIVLLPKLDMHPMEGLHLHQKLMEHIFVPLIRKMGDRTDFHESKSHRRHDLCQPHIIGSET
jgi:hypothetical protein